MGVTLGKHRTNLDHRTRTKPQSGSDQLTTARRQLSAMSPARGVHVRDLTSARPPRIELKSLVEADREPYLEAVRVSRAALDRWATLHRPEESDDELFCRQLALTESGQAHANAYRRVAWYQGRIAGGFNLTSITRGLQFEADVNWWVRSDLTRLGLGSEGLSMLLAMAFAPLPGGLGLNRVLASIRPDNLWSVRLAERTRFRRMGAERRSVLVGGRWETHDLYEQSV